MAPFEEMRAEEQNGTNVTGVKTALQLMGDDCGRRGRPSAWPLTEKQSASLRTLLAIGNCLPRRSLCGAPQGRDVCTGSMHERVNRNRSRCDQQQ